MSTLTDDCVYEYALTGKTWDGHEGATRFYTELLAAFPDLHFDLQHIVIGPQGVFEEAIATGAHQGDWQDFRATGKQVRFNVIILFPLNTCVLVSTLIREYCHLPCARISSMVYLLAPGRTASFVSYFPINGVEMISFR